MTMNSEHWCLDFGVGNVRVVNVYKLENKIVIYAAWMFRIGVYYF